MSTSHDLTVPGIGPVTLTTTEQGAGRPVLLLHGGGGPQTVLPWAGRLAAARPAHVVTPVHPGFGGTVRPDALDSVRGLAATYVALLDALELDDVVVVGNSVGGWVAAEMAALSSPRVGVCVLVNAVGLDVPGLPVADLTGLSPAEIAQLSYADPTRAVDPATLPPQVRDAVPGNLAALQTYGGPTMTDPTLAGRLAAVSTPTAVVWGVADRIVTPDYGRAYAAAVPGATYTLVDDAGHLPQLEAPDALVEAVWSRSVQMPSG